MTKPKKSASSSEKKTSVPSAVPRAQGHGAEVPKSTPKQAPKGGGAGNGVGKGAAKATAHLAPVAPGGKSAPIGANGVSKTGPKGSANVAPNGGKPNGGKPNGAKPSPTPRSSDAAVTASATPVGAKGKPKSKSKEPEPPPVPAAPLVPRKLPKGGPSKSDLKRYRDHLISMRRDLIASSRDLEAEVLKSSGSEFSVDHMADNGSDNYEQDFSLKLLEGEGEQLAEIRDALLKIDGKLDPPYGVCEPCSDEDQSLCATCPWIPSARLDAMPHARMCVQTKELDEKRRA